MSLHELGFYAAILGLISVGAFTQSAGKLAASPAASLLLVLSLPMLIALTWRVSLDMGWFAAFVVVGALVLAGIVNGIFGSAVAHSMQTPTGTVALAATIASWFAR